MVREYLPQDIAVNVNWIVNLQTPATTSVSHINNHVSLHDLLTLNNVFIALTALGVLLFMIHLYKHFQWLRTLKNNSSFKRIEDYKAIPVYSSDLISNALLIGYKYPEIWVNTKLVDSPYLEIVLEHEMNHFKQKDNYWLLLLQFVQSIYWWNPLIRLLVSNIETLIEARCDYISSHSFNEGIYQQKLTDLIVASLPIVSTRFASTVVCKNSNINRLKLLKEKQTMNLLSKLTAGLLFVTGVAILTLPISSTNIFASNEIAEKFKAPNALTMNFIDIPLEQLAPIITEIYKLEPNSYSDEIKNELISVKIESVHKDEFLKKLTELTNIEFKIINNQLAIKILPNRVRKNKSEASKNAKTDS
ncbi:MAG: M56 family metallopeptidase [Gammaproteobacteria bacterium]|nr:M56 family metallopeptidase [Gammaproteobacteria bacterium]